MPLNVDFLKQFPQWQSIYESASEAETHVYSKPRTSLFYSRVTLERAVHWLYSNDDYLQYPSKDKPMLGDLIHEQTFQENLSPGMLGPLKLIISLGNKAVHRDEPLGSDKSLLIFEHLFTFLNWLQRYYSENKIKDLIFNPDLIPVADGGVSHETIAELSKLEQTISEKDARLADAEAEIAKLRKELADASTAKPKREKKERITLSPQSEAKTRQLLIDVMLQEAKWDPHGDNVREFEVSGMPNRTSTGFCDYVLWSDSGLPLAVIEVKSTVHDAKKGKKQAELYADRLEEKYRVRPIIFYTNGYQTYIWDDLYYPPREVATFYRKDELEWVIQRRENKNRKLIETIPDQRIAGRVYQIEGIRRVGEAYESSRRHALMVMATGTGKTRTSIALTDFLKRAGWVKNVLFLADRRELVNQACGEFKKHLPRETICNLLEDKQDTSARIYFSTYQTMLGFLFPKKEIQVPFGVAHFDLIIIDEAHRSIYNKYGNVFRYFDALLLGLTATPKAEVDRDTYDFFGLDRNLPTFAYEYEQAIEEGHLVPVKPVKVKFKFMHDGIDPNELSVEELEDYNNRVRPIKGNKVEKDALNNWLFNKNTVRQALDLLITKGIKVEGGDRIGKTIIFARNQKHADFIVDIFDEMYPNLRGKFMTTVHNKVDYVDDVIRKFKKPDKLPQIAVSVDMLDTGIDVPEVANLVMFRPVFSYSKFWQMIGRGTRLCLNLFGPDDHKTHALLFDMCGNVEYFDELKEEDEGSKIISLSEQLFQQRAMFVSELEHTNQCPDILNETITYVTNQLIQMDEHHFTVRPHLPVILKYRLVENWTQLNEKAKEEIVSVLAPIVYEDVSEEKKRFDLLIIKLQRSTLGVSAIEKLNYTQGRLIKIAEQLLQKQNIKQIQDHSSMLKKIVSEDFFQQTNVEELERVRIVIRELLSLLDTEQRTILYTNFTDLLKELDEESNLPQSSDFSAYKKHVSEYIKKHQDHIAVQKLRKNKPINAYDVSSFANMLFNEQIGTKEQFERLFGTEGESSFGVFVRELVGLEQAAAREAFESVLSKASLNSNQIHFINLIIDYLSKNGNLDPGKLMDEPFVHVHQDGVFGLFSDTEVEEVVQIVRFLQRNAKVQTIIS